MRRIGTIAWMYGVTTVPERMKTLLPRTLASLANAGFNKPRLFIDDCSTLLSADYTTKFNLEVSARHPRLRTAGHWVLSMYELYLRDPTADRYALFQDDMVTYRDLRKYLEKCPYPEKGYLNLYTFPSNQSICPVDQCSKQQMMGWYLSNQYGRGAVALVFSRESLITLLGSPYLAARPQDCTRGHRAIDGGIVESMKLAGWQEWVHNPSLVQHTGEVSSMGNKPHKLSLSFRGEEFSALDLLAEVAP